MHTTVLVVGAGLSGLLTSYRLVSKGVDVQLVEARQSLGGRILCHPFPGTGNEAVDMGPAWFWPGQTGMQLLVKELGLKTAVYEQYSHGLSVMEYASGAIQHSDGGASMAGSLRLKGGMHRLINELALFVDSGRIHTDSQVLSISDQQACLSTSVSMKGVEHSIQSQYVVLAVPPRVVTATIRFEPDLPEPYRTSLQQTPTWMAAQAKCVAIYSSAFWRSQGLSGDGFSQLGPLTEIHDASSDDASHAALFGFISVPEHLRRDQEAAMRQAVIEQLVRMFGNQAGTPIAIHIKDWAHDPYTCTQLDLQPARRAGPDIDWSQWGGRLVWAGAETASLVSHANGYMEGAVEAGNRAGDKVLQSLGENHA